MLSFVAVAQHGVFSTPGKLENLGFADPEGAAQAVLENPDIADRNEKKRSLGLE